MDIKHCHKRPIHLVIFYLGLDIKKQVSVKYLIIIRKFPLRNLGFLPSKISWPGFDPPVLTCTHMHTNCCVVLMQTTVHVLYT